MATEHISAAWKAYKRNLWDIIASVIVMGIIVAVPLLIAFVPLLFAIGNSITTVGLLSSPTTFNQVLISALVSNIPVLILTVIFFIIAMLVAMALNAGFTKVIYDSLKGRARVDTMINVARKKFWTIIGANLLVTALALLAFMVIVVPIALVSFVATLNVAVSTIFFILGTIVWILIVITFGFVDQAIVIDNFTAVDAVKHSVKVVRKNYLDLLALILVFFFINIVLLFIPIVGSIVISFVTAPLAILAYTSLYVKRKRSR